MLPWQGATPGVFGNPQGLPYKIGDLDPRDVDGQCFTVFEKLLAIGGGVLEAIWAWLNQTKRHNEQVGVSA